MTYEQIIEKLQAAASVDPVQLIPLWNDRCYDWKYYDDVIYHNTLDNLRELLDDDPVEAFATGRATAGYFYSDNWLSLDGYDRPVSCTNNMLVDKFIYLRDLANWIDETMDEDEQEAIFEDLELE